MVGSKMKTPARAAIRRKGNASMTQVQQAREKQSPAPNIGSQSTLEASEAERQFLTEMSALSRKYGLGITGDASVFIMEWDDDERVYRCDSEGKLSFR